MEEFYLKVTSKTANQQFGDPVLSRNNEQIVSEDTDSSNFICVSSDTILMNIENRNYIPEDKSLLELRKDPIKIIDIKPLVSEQLELAKNAAAPYEITAENLRHKKIDEDLKRNIKKKMDILKIATRQVIVEFSNAKYHSSSED